MTSQSIVVMFYSNSIDNCGYQGNSYCDITKSCYSKHSQQFGPSINNTCCQGKTLFSDILTTVAMHNYICQATTSMTSQGFSLVLRHVDDCCYGMLCMHNYICKRDLLPSNNKYDITRAQPRSQTC